MITCNILQKILSYNYAIIYYNEVLFKHKYIKTKKICNVLISFTNTLYIITSAIENKPKLIHLSTYGLTLWVEMAKDIGSMEILQAIYSPQIILPDNPSPDVKQITVREEPPIILLQIIF